MQSQARYCNNFRCTEYMVPYLFSGNEKRCPVCDVKTKYLQPGEDIPPAAYVDNAINATKTIGPRPEITEVREEKPLAFSSNCDLKNCPVAPAGIRVHVPFPLFQQWIYLTHKFSVEWIAYLTGALNENVYTLDANGMYFPTQEASGASVIPLGTIETRENTIGSVHSHVDFSAVFSDTDEEHFSHPVELVVNRYGKMACVTRVKLDCGRFQRVASKVEIVGSSELMACAKDLASKLKLEERVVRSVETKDLTIIGGGTIYPTDRPTSFETQRGPSAQTYNQTPTAAGAKDNPTDKAVEMALAILDRHIQHKHLSERTEQHDPST